ncbi:MAG: S9 family peptidase [Bacteroidales bacterium]|jgi:dipeptidyl aminopeptidase/acylaminoacyl peptidase
MKTNNKFSGIFVPVIIFIFFLFNNLSAQIAVKDFFRNPESTNYLISPDGSFISYLSPFENKMNIFVLELATNKVTRVTSEKETNINTYYWVTDKRLIYLKDNNNDENYKLYAVDFNGKKLKPLIEIENVKTQIITQLEGSTNNIIVGLNKRNPQVFDPYRLNIETGELTMLGENTGSIQKWLPDHQGNLRIAVSSDGVNTNILYRPTESDEFKTIYKCNFKERFNPMLFTLDDKNLIASTNIGRDKVAIIKFDVSTGKEIEIVYENTDYDIERLFWSPLRKELDFVEYSSSKIERFFFNEDMKKMMERIGNELKNYEIHIVDNDIKETKFVIYAYNDKTLGAYYLYDKVKDALSKIGDVSPWLKEEAMAETKPIEFKTRDGLTIQGYLTIPKGKEQKDLPVVVVPHDNPYLSRDKWGLNPEVQFLANRGYAVLQMNYRGSWGYGKKFREMGFKQWGKNMQNDIIDGVNWLIEQGIADKKRIAIYGFNYGGYTALAGLTFTPDIFACGIDYAGIPNLFSYIRSFPSYLKAQLKMSYETICDPNNDTIYMKEASPLFFIDKISAPLLIAHGARDQKVNKGEVDQIVEALRAKNIDVEYLVKNNEGHGFLNEENKFALYETIDKFLYKYIGEGRQQK